MRDHVITLKFSIRCGIQKKITLNPARAVGFGVLNRYRYIMYVLQ